LSFGHLPISMTARELLDQLVLEGFAEIEPRDYERAPAAG
jgi:hypothetical protein